jgi:CarD family transcriptional regulator
MSKKNPLALEFRANEYVVYPAHGVGKIVSIEKQEIAGMDLELFVISFEKDKMTLRVPTAKATSIGMRSLSSPDLVAQALSTLKGRAKVKRAMWSRRAQEYEQKIHVRDLYRGGDQPEQSYSERQLYEAALERLTREVAAVERVDESNAAEKVDAVLVAKAA